METKTLGNRRIGVDVMAPFFLLQHLWLIFFELDVRSIRPSSGDWWGESVFRCITVRYKFALWSDPVIGVEKSWDISTSFIDNFTKSFVFLMKDDYYCLLKIDL